MNYLILAGGAGTRIKSVAKNLPKPLVKIFGVPSLIRIINQIKLFDNESKIFISCFYKSDQIIKAVKDINNVICLKEPSKLGTGGAVKYFLNKSNVNDFCLLNGDTLINFDFDYLKFRWNQKKNKYGIKSMVFLKKMSGDCSDFGTYKVNSGKVISFKEKSKTSNALVSTGVYFFNSVDLKKEFLGFKKKFSFEEDFLPHYIKKNKLAFEVLSEFDNFFDIGTLERLKKAKNNFFNLLKRPAAFFDRDNTLVFDEGYNANLKNYVVLKDAYLITSLFKSLGFLVFIVSNQSSIGRKINKKTEVKRFNNHLIKDFKRMGIYITESVFCEHHPDDNCNCRKPKTQMVDDLILKYNLDEKNSIFFGDSASDEKLAKKKKMKFQKLGFENDLRNTIKLLKKLNFN
tara:strand:+ start:379 stop:1581 length:1203 start_codon:yes stop_codon:yes gene_type:complete